MSACLTGQERLLDRAVALDGPGARVSHAEALDLYLRGVTSPAALSRTLRVSASTASRLLRNLRHAEVIGG